MPSFLPKTARRQTVYPACVELRAVFDNPVCKNTLDRVVTFIAPIYKGYSNKSFEDRMRRDFVTEEFFLCMPTIDAYMAEIDLVNTIHEHALGKCPDEHVKVTLKKYIDTHLFVYKTVKSKCTQEFKTGYSPQTGKDIDIYSVTGKVIGSGCVGNAIQAALFIQLEQKIVGNGNDYKVTRL